MRGQDSKIMMIEELESSAPSAMSGEQVSVEDSPEEKSVVPFKSGDNKASLQVAPIVEKKVAGAGEESFSDGFINRDAEMAKVAKEKRMALIKAWEESEKAKAENRAYKNITLVGSWEERKKAILEVQLKEVQEKLENKKAEYAEKKKNKVAELHKLAQEKRAAIEAHCSRNIVEIVGRADTYRASGRVPKKLARCFNSISC